MKILVINAGSSSLKFKLWDMPNEQVVAFGAIEKINSQAPEIVYFRYGNPVTLDEKYQQKNAINNHMLATQVALQLLLDLEIGVISSIDEINATGHRVVHGGEKYKASTLITSEVLNDLKKYAKLAPLHNPANISGIEACHLYMPGTPMVAVFDTAFHQTMAPEAYLYALPYEIYKKYSVRRYGFHGISHQYIAQRVNDMVKHENQTLKIISCHLGNGASIAAIKDGKSVATSMGFTPIAGLIMGTRCGDLDPGLVLYLIEEIGYSANELNEIFNKKSGLLGISGASNDLRDLHKLSASGNSEATLAIEIFVYQIRYHIGALVAAMNGVDIIVFTAGIGENDSVVREKVINEMSYLGAKLDLAQNNKNACVISADDSKVKVLRIPTNEELLIARETIKFI